MKQNLIKVILKSGKDSSLRRFHPWVFSGAVKKCRTHEGKETEPNDGEIVYVTSNNDEFLGIGHYQNWASISVRILSFTDEPINQDFWNAKISQAFALRKKIGLTHNANTNCYRLVHAEGDHLPGLIIDFYNGTAVFQAHSVGMYQNKTAIIEALKNVLGDSLIAIYDKSADTLPKNLSETIQESYLYQKENSNFIAMEHNCKYKIDWLQGQKTGFFIDQRDNRMLVASYAAQKKVLNTFCYTGGFSVAALKYGASKVHSVDASKRAIELCDENIALNGFQDKHKSYAMDVFKYFEAHDISDFDIVVLDPPAFAKHQNVKHNAVQGYKRLNATAMKLVKPGALIFTFSCSQVIDHQLFYNTILSAAIQSERKVRVLHRLNQPADHPTNIFHAESSYLKGLVIEVI